MKVAKVIKLSLIGIALPYTLNAKGPAPLDTVYNKMGGALGNVEVVARQAGTRKLSGVVNGTLINGQELLRAACCNLGESFTTNPSVDVSYSDAATGAKQIKLLGLNGKYVQILTENIPNYRGAAALFALGYIPGPWMQSIQVSTGAASVKNGYESITGQIDVEFKKPQAPESIEANVYGNSKSKLEANFNGNIHFNNLLSTAILGHYENQFANHDINKDGFLDMPKVEQYNLQNRWMYRSNKYIFQTSVKGLKEIRTGGQDKMLATHHDNNKLYSIHIGTTRYEAFTKNAFIFNQEHNTNIALILSGTFHQQDANYGYKNYDVIQKNGYASLLFETDFNAKHKLSTGLSLNHDYYYQQYNLQNIKNFQQIKNIEKETVPGAYTQYTYNLNDKIIAMAGLRVDYSDIYGIFVTPRAHLKWAPNEYFALRLSAGEGYRTNHVLAESNYLLASGREIIIDNNLNQDRAWNFGISTSNNFYINRRKFSINIEYYFTNFVSQVINDLDTNPEVVHFTNLKGKSYSHTFQVDASYELLRGLSLTVAYRLNDVKETYNGKTLAKPLTNKSKGLFSTSYKTPLGLWQFDATLLLNGSGRMPTAYTLSDGNKSWENNYPSYEQLSAQVTRFFRWGSIYLGGENLTNFKQTNPIINASDPWSKKFDSTLIWGPIEGAMAYLGIRLSLKKL